MAKRLMKLSYSKSPLVGSIDFSDERIVDSFNNRPKSIAFYVKNDLFHRREKFRVEALSNIIEAFTNNIQHEVAQDIFCTMMFRCLNLVKRSSAKEICLATKAIGLLAIVIGPGNNGHELYEESLSTYCQVLNFKAESIQVLESLAIVSLVGANDFHDTEKSMKIIWEFIHPNSSCNIVVNKSSTPVLAAAISAWSFLLTTIDGRMLDHKYWQGAITYFLSLLEKEESLRAASVEALSIIFEKGCVEKFSSEAYKTFVDSLTAQEDTISCLEEWKNEIVVRINQTCELELFEDEYRSETMNMGGNTLTLSTLSQLKKMKFVKQFLGDGFVKHMMENNLLYQVLEFTPEDHPQPQPSGPELYIPEIEELNVRYFSPDIKKEKSKQRFEKSPNSLVNKARTQMMKQQRMVAQKRKTGDFEL